ncbi:MAG: ribbon-helix-helix domain-containing protein [Ketobacter sp.]|nr:ribbon-helix-helix domain-containing protein [Ketobacter sp.]
MQEKKVRIPDHQYRRLEERKKQTGLPIVEQVRQAIDLYIRKQRTPDMTTLSESVSGAKIKG